MSGTPNIDLFYASYCARPKPGHLILARSQSVLQSKGLDTDSRDKRRIVYDGDECIRFLAGNSCSLTQEQGGPAETYRAVCKRLLEQECDTPKDTAFEEHTVQATLDMFESNPENAVIRVIGELVVPSLETFLNSDTLVYSMDEPWGDSIPLDQGVPPLQQTKYYLRDHSQIMVWDSRPGLLPTNRWLGLHHFLGKSAQPPSLGPQQKCTSLLWFQR
ncbi:hypothetical protein BDW59DRAFT_143457 [Aspergillus cavernicola]|uniref:Uncharacterized protein n=1 Tax=Aspergillus cavernicola TaxID=176166 RepID=A0ABR4IKH5_9EURO